MYITTQTKSVLSLEDRVAQILKRTGSSAFPSPKVIAERESKHSGDDDDHDHDAVRDFVWLQWQVLS